MLRKLSAVLVCSLVCSLVWLAVPSAHAAEADDEEASASNDADDEKPAYDRDGWYAGIGGGGAIALFDDGDSADSGFAQIRAGYHFLRFAALEAELEYTPRFHGKSGRYDGVDTATFGAWANIKGYPMAPWTGCVQPFGMIGVGWWWERLSGSAVDGVDQKGGFVSRYGGGVDFYVTRNVMVTTEAAWVLPTGHLGDLKQVQIGGAVQYRF